MDIPGISSCVQIPSYKDIRQTGLGSAGWPHLTLITSVEVLSLQSYSKVLRVQPLTYGFGEGSIIQPLTVLIILFITSE